MLIIRLHAIGDVAITFPSCTALRDQLPMAQLDYLTTASCSSLAQSLETFNNVHILGRCRNTWERAYRIAALAATIYKQHYDVVLDLQENWVSRSIRRAARTDFWGEFDSRAKRSAPLRVLDTLHRTGFTSLIPSNKMRIKHETLAAALKILTSHGWDANTPLIVLNPAGLWETRNWPIDNYVRLATLLHEREAAQFVFLGTERISEKARYIGEHLRCSTINLTQRTSLGEAFAILQYVSLMISEDSGMMHMAWVSDIPTVALFGSSDHTCAMPLGEAAVCLHSGDLSCGACMQPTCRYGDVHCLTRYSPEMVFQIAHQMLSVKKETLEIL